MGGSQLLRSACTAPHRAGERGLIQLAGLAQQARQGTDERALRLRRLEEFHHPLHAGRVLLPAQAKPRLDVAVQVEFVSKC